MRQVDDTISVSGVSGERVTWYGLLGNIALAGFKVFCGVFGGSQALIADAIHSTSDIGATTTVLLGLKIAKRPKDETHPYGHGRIESIVALIVGTVLIAAAGVIVVEAVHTAFDRPPAPPGWLALVGASASIVVKEWMFRYTLKAGKRLNSPSIIANAWDHRSDAYSSLGVLAGIAGAKLGYPILDPIAAGVVSFFIFKVGSEIIRNAFHDLMDRALPQSMVDKIRNLAQEVNGVLDVSEVKGRRMGSKIVADLRVTVSGFASAKEGHDIARRVEAHLMDSLFYLSDVMIHVDVDESTLEARQSEFKERTQDILARHQNLFREIHELDYHFSSEGQEIHFHLVVPENTSFEDAHALSKHLEEEIQRAFPESSVVVHMEPVSQIRGTSTVFQPKQRAT